MYSDSQLIFIRRFSGCLKYQLTGELTVIQKMTDERDFPKPVEKEAEDSPIEGISIEQWTQIKSYGKKDEILNFLRDFKAKENNEGI